MRPTTLFRLALAGTRADALRVGLTAISSALATVTLLSTATVLAIRGDTRPTEGRTQGWADQYSNALLREPGLRPGVALALCLLALPILGLAAQCSRLGAPERDRRLAGIRLAGASPRQAAAIAVGETGLAATLGAALGLGGFLVGRAVAHQVDPITRQLPLPTDVRLPWWLVAVVCLAVPAAAAGLAGLTLRRVTFGPFGITQRVRTGSPRPWPAALILLGFGVYPLLGAALSRQTDASRIPTAVIMLALLGGAAMALTGLILGTGWLTAFTGRMLRRRARRAAPLLAAARLVADPWSTARSYTGLLLAVAFGAGAVGVAAVFDAHQALYAEHQRVVDTLLGQSTGGSVTDPFYDRAFQIIYYAVAAGTVVAAAALLVAVAEAIVTRRRTYAALVATGVPRSVLARASVWQTLAPLVVAVPATVAISAALPVAVLGRPTMPGYPMAACSLPDGTVCQDEAAQAQYERIVQVPDLSVPLPVPWLELAAIGGLGLLTAFVVTVLALVVLGPSTRPQELRV